jgi:hypothetical protein
MVFIGYVLRKNTNNGKIFVKIQNGFELQELHNVAISNPVTGQVLKYNATTQLWSNDTDAGGINTLNGLTASTQTFATGTSGTDFGIVSATGTHTFNLPTASASARGLLSSADWSTFNGKQGALSLTTTGTSGAATLVGSTLNVPQYQAVLTNPVTGTGTSGQVAYFNGTSAVTGSANLFWDNANGRLGIGTNAPTSRLHLVQTDTGTSGLIGYQNSITSNPTANKSTATYGASFETTIAGTFQSTNVLSFQARVNITNTNVNNQVRGLLGRVTTSSTGNAFSAIGVQSLIEHNSTGTITSAYGLSISNIVNSGTITNTYGIYIGDMTTGTQTNTPYAIYSEDASAISYLAGSTSIGTTTSSARLHVRGSGTTSATTALLVQNSTPTNLLQVLDNGRINQTLEGASLSTAFGSNALRLDSGGSNVGFGNNAGNSNTTGTSNSFFGRNAGNGNTTGNNNVNVGFRSGENNTTGSTNTFLGSNAGRYITGGATALTIANNSIFLGFDTRANADNETNQIVIGYQTTGLGSNTTTIGNASTTNNYIYGNFNIIDKNIVLGTTTGTKIGTANTQKLSFWNATPVAQPTTAIAEATFTENSGGTAVNVDSTFAGYTLQQIAQALKDIGILQ